MRLSVAGRTDAGVHALAQVASFAAVAAVEPRRLRLALSALLPAEISVTAVAPAAAGFDARAAAARTYRYRLWLPDWRPVFERVWVWDVRGARRPRPARRGRRAAARPPRLRRAHAVGALLPHLRA